MDEEYIAPLPRDRDFCNGCEHQENCLLSLFQCLKFRGEESKNVVKKEAGLLIPCDYPDEDPYLDEIWWFYANDKNHTEIRSNSLSKMPVLQRHHDPR